MGAEPENIPRQETREEVMFFDTDAGGVVHNIAYLRFIETCRTRLAAQMGMSLREMAASGIYAVVTRTEIDYKKPAVLADELIIRGRAEKMSTARLWCAFEVVRAVDEVVLVICRQALALVKMPEGRPQRLPEEWREKWPELFSTEVR
jgi:YbgC/YbaW family acyl-CoA thioester hydrolase